MKSWVDIKEFFILFLRIFNRVYQTETMNSTIRKGVGRCHDSFDPRKRNK